MPITTVQISRRILDRYLLDDEVPVVATRQHWVRLTEPFASVLVGLILVAAISATLDARGAALGTFLWVLWFLLLGRAIWRLLEWYNEWFVATDRRMLMVYGLITHKVAMMPLRKVTDMNYGRSVLGRLLGYGQFVLESAGQDQAMREIRWVPDPDEKYRRICSTIFGPDGQDPEDGAAQPRDGAAGAMTEHVDADPWETSWEDSPRPLADRFDPDVVSVSVHTRRPARGHADRRPDASPTPPPSTTQRRQRWEAVDRHELPHDWEWVDEEAARARAATRSRTVAVDPDPTPWQ